MEFRILGSLEVLGDHGAVSLGGPQQRRILAVLLSDPGRVLTYDRLVEVLWADNDEPPNARRSALSYVSRLRSAVGAGVVQTTDAGYALDPDSASVDADRFLGLLNQARAVPADRALGALDEALALWRGPVFGDLNGEWWARPLVKKLDEMRLAAMAERIDALTAGGWDARSLAEAVSLVDAHPLREQFVDRAMRGLHSLGQTADALRLFQSYRSGLVDQTGLDPSAALVELERSMATGAAVDPTAGDLARPLRGYVLRDLIGEGTFGTVYRATQPGVERDVAVKVIRAELADDRSFIRRFEAEAQLVARLEHPNIVPLYDFWRQPGGAFLVFRLMRGGSAAELLRENGPISLERAGSILEQVGGALSAAHAYNVVHRDVKPSNILFDQTGVAYLADFGIAATLTHEPMIPQRWSAGAALYASPEQLRDGIEDARADQYALATTIWELLSGSTPFTGYEASAVARIKIHEPIGDVSRIRPDVPAAVSAVLCRAGSVQPADRFGTVSEMVSAWKRAASDDLAGITAPPAADSPHRRRPQVTIGGADRPTVNPYKGLRPFREADAADFRGRGELIRRLAEAAKAARFVAVVGPSGSGKSSLVLAGLVPRLRAGGCRVATLTPGDNPIGSFGAALSLVASGEQAGLLSTAALGRPDGIGEAIRSISAADRLAIVIDQLEELWTLSGENDCRRLLDALVAAVRDGDAQVVGTIRADFFDRPLADPALGPLVSQHTFGVTPMSVADLHEAITAPAEQVGVRFEPALTSQLIAETIDQPGSLPLLQFTLAELFESRDGAIITLAAYDQLGGLAGSLSRQADEIYESFDAGDRAAVRRMFSRLVTPGEGNEDTRRRVNTTDLAGVPERVAAAFVARRLLTSDRDRGTRQPTLEVAHEVLLRAWPRLRGWLAEDRAWLRELRALTTAAGQWDSGGRDAGDLYRGARLAVIGELAAAHEGALTELEATFLARSLDAQAAQEREAERQLAEKVRQNRRLRRSLVGLAAVLVLALVAGAVAVRQQRAAVKAKTGSELTSLATRSLAVRSSQRDLAALLAVEAWKRRPDAVAKSALFGTFTFDPGFLGYIAFDGATNVNAAAVPGTSQMLVSSFPRISDRNSHYGPVRLVDVVTRKIGVQLDPLIDGGVQDLVMAVSADGHRAAVLGSLKGNQGPAVAAVFDLSTGHKVGATIEPPAWRYTVALNPDGSTLVVAGDHGGAIAYDVGSGREIARIPELAGAPRQSDPAPPLGSGALAYGPDGRLYVGSLGDRLRVFDPTTFVLTKSIPVPLYATAGTLKFTADGAAVVARGVLNDETNGSQLGAIARIDLGTGTTVWQISGDDYGDGECASFAFSESTNRLWCGTYSGLIRERSLLTGLRTGQILAQEKGWIATLDLIDTANGQVLASAGVNSETIGRWKVDGGAAIARRVAGDRTIVGELADDKTLLVATPGAENSDWTLSLWDSTTDSEAPGLPTFVYAEAVGNTIDGAFTHTAIGTYNVATREERSIAVDETRLTWFTISRDGSELVTSDVDGHVVLYEVSTGRIIQQFTVPSPIPGTNFINRVAISDDHSRIYVAGHGLWAYDASTGKQLAHHDAPTWVVVGPVGVVVGSVFGGKIGTFDPDTLEEMTSLPGSGSPLVSDDGTVLLVKDNNNVVSLIDLKTGILLGDPIATVESGCFCSPDMALRGDGLQAATTGPDGKGVVLWDLDPEHWATAACAIAGRNLNKQEWATYIGDLGDYRATCPEYPAAT